MVIRSEVALDGSIDENVFDIMQGVSINLFIKTGKKKEVDLGQIYHYDLFGKREAKYNFLSNTSLSEINFEKLNPIKPNIFFIPRDNSNSELYNRGFSTHKVFTINSTGIQTSRDAFVIDFNKKTLLERINDFADINKTDQEVRIKYFSHKTSSKYKMGDTRGWKIEKARQELQDMDIEAQLQEVSYRPFDKRFLFYSDSMVDWTRRNVMFHLQNKDNYSLLIPRQLAENDFYHVLVEKKISEMCVISNKTKEQNVVFPLYLYPEKDTQTELLESKERQTRTPNLDPKIVADIAKGIGLTFTNEKEDTAGTFAPIDILDYIYAVLHSPTYRETYKEFLKIDFPRVPYPRNANTFWQLVALGSELRQIHLLESPKLATQTKALGIGYPVGGDNAVTRKMTKTSVGFEPDEVDSSIGKVWLNDTQYFTNVPLVAWEFYIGGYQPAQKWLKDRQGRTLDMSDVRHYMNIIAALSLTADVMQQIDEIDVVG